MIDSVVAVVILLGTGEAALLWRLRSRLRGSTAMAAWWWATVATVVLIMLEMTLAMGSREDDRVSGAAWRFMAAALTFCPMMAVLGAKRPQHQAWQFVVLSFWGVLALPAVESLVLERGETLEVHGVRQAFVVGLIGLGLLNWLPTRFWFAAILVGAGQTLLFAPFLPAVQDQWTAKFSAPFAAACFVAATGAVLVAQVARQRSTEPGLDRMWRDFRDWFGALWALRVAERINATASQRRWPLRLAWSGFVFTQTEEGAQAEDVQPPPDFEVALDNLLRRFVAPEWIAKRRGQRVH